MISVILAGGSGERFWPLSREKHPKQLLKITGDKTLIQQSVERLLTISRIEEIYVVTNEQYALKTLQQLAQYNFPCQNLFAEPLGKNTTPAIVWMTEFLNKNPDEIMGVFPADHIVRDSQTFQKTLQKSESAAKENSLVTIGIKPNRPETGYGYIELGKMIQDSVFRVNKFVEKPNKEIAQKYVAGGKHLWNCGIFLWKVSVIRKELQKWVPDISNNMSSIISKMQPAEGRFKYQKLDPEGVEIFSNLPSVSIDYAVLEKSQNVTVVSTNMDWNDVGSWNALESLSTKDLQGNIFSKNVYHLDCKGTLIKADQRLIGAIGLENLIVVDTEDALLLCHKDRAQDIKKLVGQLKKAGRQEASIHKTVQKPWGSYTVLDEGKGFLLKRIEVDPGESLSLQSHAHRSEHWLVVAGTATVQLDSQSLQLKPTQSIEIPKGSKHRLSNSCNTTLVLIETQLGDILEEKDIVRYEDQYGRLN